MKDLVIIGAGGHSRPLLETAYLEKKWSSIKIIDKEFKKVETILDSELVGGFDKLHNFDKKKTQFIIGVGDNIERKFIYESLKDMRLEYTNLVHPKAIVSKFSKIGLGNFIGPFSNIGPGVEIGNQNIINSYADIEHEVTIGHFCQIAPHALICGRSLLGDRIFIGANSTVIEKVEVPSGLVLGAGSVIVNSNLTPNAKYVGTPARKL